MRKWSAGKRFTRIHSTPTKADRTCQSATGVIRTPTSCRNYEAPGTRKRGGCTLPGTFPESKSQGRLQPWGSVLRPGTSTSAGRVKRKEFSTFRHGLDMRNVAPFYCTSGPVLAGRNAGVTRLNSRAIDHEHLFHVDVRGYRLHASRSKDRTGRRRSVPVFAHCTHCMEEAERER